MPDDENTRTVLALNTARSGKEIECMGGNWFSMSNRRLRRMNPRQRKKHHAGEWRELGFQVRVRLKEGTDESAFDALIDDLILFIEARSLLMGGFGNPSELWHESFVWAAGRGSASDEDRFAVRDWLAEHPAVEEVQTDELVDAWYGWETER
ncbi:MAG TPA: 50S ribosome-binding protein YggL [Azoarcus taiwanensis]|nr:50S ribosome-binding protein YggL [Azoarcus taiwanensis]